MATQQSQAWCNENFIQHRQLRRAGEVRQQLEQLLAQHRMPTVSAAGNMDLVRQAIVAGFFSHAARRDAAEGCFRTLVEQTPVNVHPSSSIFSRSPDWVIVS